MLKPICATFLLVSITLLAGCATSETVGVRVMRPAAVDLGRYEVVAVDAFSGHCCEQLGAVLADALRRSPNPLTGRTDFAVVDRSQLDHVLDGLRHRRGGALDPETQSLLESWKNADLRIQGTVPVNEVEDRVIEKEFVDEQGNWHVTYTRQCNARVSVVITAHDQVGHNVIDRVRLDESASARTVAVDRAPAPIDHGALMARAQQALVQRYVRRVRPHEDWVRVRLFTDSDLPELKVGNGLARTGSWEDALESYDEAARRCTGELAEIRYKALFNKGVALGYSGRFAEARLALKEAWSLEQDARILREIEALAHREQELERLSQQGRATPAN